MGVDIHSSSSANQRWRREIREEILKREKELEAAKADSKQIKPALDARVQQG